MTNANASSGRNYYEVLEVGKEATPDEIKKAYRRKAIRFHPDKHGGISEMEEKFKDVNEAYQTLSNDKKRRRYDAILEGKAAGGSRWDEAWSAAFSEMFRQAFEESERQRAAEIPYTPEWRSHSSMMDNPVKGALRRLMELDQSPLGPDEKLEAIMKGPAWIHTAQEKFHHLRHSALKEILAKWILGYSSVADYVQKTGGSASTFRRFLEFSAQYSVLNWKYYRQYAPLSDELLYELMLVDPLAHHHPKYPGSESQQLFEQLNVQHSRRAEVLRRRIWDQAMNQIEEFLDAEVIPVEKLESTISFCKRPELYGSLIQDEVFQRIYNWIYEDAARTKFRSDLSLSRIQVADQTLRFFGQTRTRELLNFRIATGVLYPDGPKMAPSTLSAMSKQYALDALIQIGTDLKSRKVPTDAAFEYSTHAANALSRQAQAGDTEAAKLYNDVWGFAMSGAEKERFAKAAQCRLRLR